MKKIFTLLFALLLFAGSSWGTTITIGSGTSTQRQPLGNYWGYERTAALYTAAEMTTGGTIDQIAWYATTARTANVPVKIYLKETASATLTAVTWATMISGATLCYDATITSNAANAWNNFILSTTFGYGGSNNLLVLVETNVGGVGPGTVAGCGIRYSTAATSYEYWYADNSAPTGTGSTGSTRPNVQLNITTAGVQNPSAFTATPFSSSQINLSWALNGNGNAVLLVYNTTNSFGTPVDGNTYTTTGPGGIGTVLYNGTNTSFNHTPLSASTPYYYKIWSKDGSTVYSSGASTSATTLCGTTTVPYSDNFDSYTVPATGCWTVQDVNSDGTTWGTYNSTSPTPNSLPNCMRISYNSSLAMNDWFFSPGMNLVSGSTYSISFYYTGSGATFPEALEVKYGTTPSAAGMTSPQVWNNSNITNNTWALASASFTAPSTGTFYIGFHGYSAANMFYLGVDDISVNVVNVAPPTAFTATPFSSSQINLGWTLNGSGNAVLLVFNTTNSFGTPVDGVSYTTTGPGGIGTVLYNGTNTTFNHTPLSSNTPYYYKLWSKNGSNVYSSGVTANATTPCASTTVPYTENFDSYTPPATGCLTVQNVNGDAYTWVTSSSYYHSSPNGMYIRWNSAMAMNDWFFTQGLNLVSGATYNVSFWYTGSGTTFPEKLEVKYGTAPNAAAMTSPQIFNNSNITNSSFVQATTSFIAPSTGTFYIGFHGYSDANEFYLVVDDISVTIAPMAPTVTTNAATVISSSGATLNATVSANYASTAVTFEYGTMSSPPFDHTTSVTTVTTQGATVSTPVTGLAPNTTYYFRAVGVNSVSTTNGSVLSFLTSSIAPVVTTNGATLVGSTFATLNGTATAFSPSATVSFEYGTTLGGPYPNPVTGVPPTVSGNSPAIFSANITGLTINTDYYYRAKGVNGVGTTYGLEQHFYTTCVTPPILGAISGPANVCKNGTGYVFSVAPVPYAFVYYWSFPAGFTITSFPNSNSVTVSISVAAVSGPITVYAVSSCGAVGPTSPVFTATVRDLPVATVTGNSSVCQFISNNYTSEAGMTAYSWAVTPDGTITPTANPNVVSITWGLTGAKTVSVTYTNSYGCTTPLAGSAPVTVKGTPTPVINGVSSMCVNSGYYDYITDPGMTGYVWTVSEGGTITAGQGTYDAQVVWNTPGARFVTVNYIGLNGCSAQAPTVFDVSVNGLPGSAGTIAGSANVCFSAQGVAYTVPAITNAMSYIWTLPAGATIASGEGTNSITVNFAESAVSGDITVNGNSLCGNGAVSAPFHVTVVQIPAAAGTVTGVQTVCAGAMGVPYSVEPIANATGYFWSLPLGAFIASGENTANITVNFAFGVNSGDVYVYGINSCGHGTASPSLSVAVNEVPATPVIQIQGNNLISDAPAGNQWYYEGVPIVGGTGQSVAIHFSGWYWDQVTLNGCASDTSNNIYIPITGINEQNASGFVVYPVPNDGLFKLSMNSAATEPFSITISNNIGITVYTKENVTAKGELVIDLRPVSSGVYTMIIRNSENRIVKKIIVNR